jgi:hypothetical protein
MITKFETFQASMRSIIGLLPANLRILLPKLNRFVDDPFLHQVSIKIHQVGAVDRVNGATIWLVKPTVKPVDSMHLIDCRVVLAVALSLLR